MTAVLPPNSTAFEEALKEAAFLAIEVPVPVDTLWSAERIPAALLPFLAWALSVDDWDPEWTDERKRAVVSASFAVHRRKGTPWAVKAALAAAGYGTATLIEHTDAAVFDGAVPRDGTRTRAAADHWAEYRVILDRPMTIAQAEAVRRILSTVAPARCHLKVLDYTRAASIYNATVPRDGSYRRGIA